MLKPGLIFLILGLSVFSNGQIDILNHELIDPTEKILIRGHYNPLEVIGMEIDSTFDLISNRQDTLSKSGNYFISKGSSDSICIISIVKNGQVYFTTRYRVVKYQKPNIYLGNLRDSLVTIEELLSNLFLYLSHEPVPQKVCSFVRFREGQIIKKNGKKIDLQTLKIKKFERQDKKNGSLTEEELIKKFIKQEKRAARKHQDPSIVNEAFNKYQLKLIKKMKPGDTLWIGLCWVSCPSCVSRLYGPNLRFTIK